MRYRHKIWLLVFLLCAGQVIAQKGAEIMFRPLKYGMPQIETDLKIEEAYSFQPWMVYGDRNDINVYEDPDRIELKDRKIQFMESFYVWEESDKSVRLVESYNPEQLPFTGTYFNDYAVEVGWVDKTNLLLWDRSLLKNDLPLKVIIDKKNLDEIEPTKPYISFSSSGEGLLIYDLIKIEEHSALVSTSHHITQDMTAASLFWVPVNSITILESRNSFAPDWQKVIIGNSVKLYASKEAEIKKDPTGIIWSASYVAPQVGFILNAESPVQGYVLNYLAEPAEHGYINVDNNDYIKTLLIDVPEFIKLKGLPEGILMAKNKDEFRELIGEFFYKENVNDQENKTISELLNKITGFDFPTSRNVQRRTLENLSDRDFLSIQSEIKELYEKLESVDYMSNYTFQSQGAYYWFPENLLALDRIGGFILSGYEPVHTKISKEKYEVLDIFYIDNSDESNPINYKDAELNTLRSKLSQIWSKDQMRFGHIIYYSDGIDPILGEGSNDFQRIAGSMRQTNTVRPDEFFDKIQLENYIFDHIESVNKSINFHFFVSDQFYNNAMNNRKYLLEESVQRITRYLGGEGVKTTVTMYQYMLNNTGTNRIVDPDYFKKRYNIFYSLQSFSN